MADGFRYSFDTDVLEDALEELGTRAIDVAASMCVAGGQVIRDDARARVDSESGRLASAIYLAHRDRQSTDTRMVYSVSWNGRLAPHGHLVEFGHWRYNRITPQGIPLRSKNSRRTIRRVGPNAPASGWEQLHTLPGALDKPVWTPASPFLRPAFEATPRQVRTAMLERGEARFYEILSEIRQ